MDQGGGGDFLTIQEGVDAASDGDQVIVKPGTYNVFNFSGKAITVRSDQGPADTIIQDSDPSAARARVTFSSGEGNGSVLRGFTVTGGSGFNRSGILISGASPVIQRNVIENNHPMADGAGIQISGGSPIIQNNTIRGNVATNSYTGPGLITIRGGGIYFAGAGTPQVINNFIQGNSINCVPLSGTCYKDLGGGIFIGGGSPVIIGNVISGNTGEGNCNYGGGIFVDSTTNAVVANKTFYGNQSTSHMSACGLNIGGAGAYLGSGNSNLLFANNIIQASTGQGVLRASTSISATIQTNDLYGNSQGDYQTCPAGTGDFFVDSGLVDPVNGDFHLSSTSPLLDVGTSGIPGTPGEDVYGGLRLTDANGDGIAQIDLGAAEFSNCVDNDGDGYGSPANTTCPHPELDCDDSNPNINPGAVEVCDGVDNNCNGQIDEEPAASNSCQNGNVCDGQEYCASGSCHQGTPLNCDDGNACTNDTCDPATGCSHTPVTCYDGNACTTDTCDPAIGCVFGSVSCDDGNACTADSCDPGTGCVHTTVSCDDGNACTNDTCDPATGCTHVCNATGPADPCCSNSACLGNPVCLGCTTPPETPSLSSPSLGANNVSITPVLSWGAVSSATSYDVQVCTDSGCSSVARSPSVTATQWTVSPALNTSTGYWWRVQAVNSCGSGPWSSTWSFTTGNCFIATAAFGTPEQGKIDVLRSFRDSYLTKTRIGEAFVEAYYKCSPPVADYIAERRWLRALVRALLTPVIGFVSLLV